MGNAKRQSRRADEVAQPKVEVNSPPRVPNMHEGVTECDDPICCCEPEPRWQRVAQELELERVANDSSRRGDGLS